jgi:butyrate kinase
MYTLLTINPGSTSTKLGLYHSDQKMCLKEVFCQSVEHDRNELKHYKSPIDQLEFRLKHIKSFIKKSNITKLDCIVSRGGLVRPVKTGSYRINEKMIDDLSSNRFGSHVSNLSPILAKRLAEQFHCPAIIVDPVGVDEFIPLAYYSGLESIKRRSQLHTLNVRAVMLLACQDLNLPIEHANFIIAHLGGGITIAAVERGRIVDVNNAIDGGPFSPNRAGSLPITQLVNLCFSGKYKNANKLNRVLTSQAGLLSYLGTDNGREIVKRIKAGDLKAKEVFEAMAYQISKEIGAMAAVLSGKVNAILMTGGLSKNTLLIEWIKKSTGWIAPIHLYPGSYEQEALAKAGARFLAGEEKLKTY